MLGNCTPTLALPHQGGGRKSLQVLKDNPETIRLGRLRAILDKRRTDGRDLHPDAGAARAEHLESVEPFYRLD
jgi:hypothetical protein